VIDHAHARRVQSQVKRHGVGRVFPQRCAWHELKGVRWLEYLHSFDGLFVKPVGGRSQHQARPALDHHVNQLDGDVAVQHNAR